MICKYCAKAADTDNMDLHDNCPGKSWCDCGHKRIKDNGQRQTQGQDQTPTDSR